MPRPWTNLKPEQIELLTATGFLRTVPDGISSGGIAEAQQQVADTIKIVSSSLLGLTVGCAQCHDHKYDPIPQADYYRLRAVFEPALDPAHFRRPAQRLVSPYAESDRRRAGAVDTELRLMQADYNAKQQQCVRAAFDKELTRFAEGERDKLRAAFETPAAKRTPQQKQLVAVNPKLNIHPGVLYQYNQAAADELKKMQEKIQAKQAEKPIEDFIAVLSEEAGIIPATRIFYRGDPRQPQAEVQPSDLTIAAPDGARLEIPVKDGKRPTTGRRLAYAKHLTSGRHPLLGRVLVNRIWLHHFGRGIVDTPGDFGLLGQRPTHPELLDWLASELVRQGWSLKRLHKIILCSTVYRQSSRRDPSKDALDSDNALYGRYALRRLDAETLRDRLLATSGQLDRRLFGPPVPVATDTVGQVIAPDDKPRRTIYVQVRRSWPVAFLTAFDAPSGELDCARHISSTAAPQALMLMNSEFVLGQAGRFAQRLLHELPSDSDESARRDRRLELAWQLAYRRPIEPDELSSARRFLDRQGTRHTPSTGKSDAELHLWTNLCQQLLSSNEFLYVD